MEIILSAFNLFVNLSKSEKWKLTKEMNAEYILRFDQLFLNRVYRVYSTTVNSTVNDTMSTVKGTVRWNTKEDCWSIKYSEVIITFDDLFPSSTVTGHVQVYGLV